MKIKKGDKVQIIAGKDKGKTGTVTRALPKENQVVLEGINVVKKHQRANRTRGKGQIIERAMPIHVSNVMLVDPKAGERTRVAVQKDGGVYTRIAKKSGTKLN